MLRGQTLSNRCTQGINNFFLKYMFENNKQTRHKTVLYCALFFKKNINQFSKINFQKVYKIVRKDVSGSV